MREHGEPHGAVTGVPLQGRKQRMSDENRVTYGGIAMWHATVK